MCNFVYGNGTPCNEAPAGYGFLRSSLPSFPDHALAVLKGLCKRHAKEIAGAMGGKEYREDAKHPSKSILQAKQPPVVHYPISPDERRSRLVEIEADMNAPTYEQRRLAELKEQRRQAQRRLMELEGDVKEQQAKQQRAGLARFMQAVGIDPTKFSW